MYGNRVLNSLWAAGTKREQKIDILAQNLSSKSLLPPQKLVFN